MADDPRGGGTHTTPAVMTHADVTPAECSAMRLLAQDGYDQKELAMLFSLSEGAVSKHVNGRCKIHSYPGNHD